MGYDPNATHKGENGKKKKVNANNKLFLSNLWCCCTIFIKCVIKCAIFY